MAGEAKTAAEEAKVMAGEAKTALEEVKVMAVEAKTMAAKALREVQTANYLAKKTQLMLENDIVMQIRVIGEGHDFLKRRLDEALLMEQKRERMELDILGLKMDMKKVKEAIHIA